MDSYETVYSSTSGIDLSGVEILATGLTNLMDETSLRTCGAINGLIVIVIGIILGIVAASASDLALGGVSILLLFAVPTLGYYLFTAQNFVVPVFTPLAAQLPIGILTIALSLKTVERELRRAIENAAHQLLPNGVADRLVYGPLSANALPHGKTRSGIFLATDIGGFTTIAERLSPEVLGVLVKEYFEPLFEVIRRRGGEVLDLTGDSMVCAWYTSQEPLQDRSNAIAATLGC